MCKEWAKTDCQKEHRKQKRVAEEEEDQSCNVKTVKQHLERAGTNSQEWKTITEDRGRWSELTTKVEEATK